MPTMRKLMSSFEFSLPFSLINGRKAGQERKENERTEFSMTPRSEWQTPE